MSSGFPVDPFVEVFTRENLFAPGRTYRPSRRLQSRKKPASERRGQTLTRYRVCDTLMLGAAPHLISPLFQLIDTSSTFRFFASSLDVGSSLNNVRKQFFCTGLQPDTRYV